MINNELFSLRETNPDKFWGEISNILLEEYRSVKFQRKLEQLSYLAIDDFRKKKDCGAKIPYHIGYCIDDEGFRFHYFVHMIAQNEFQRDYRPKSIIVGVFPFPNESFYSFRINDDGLCKNEIDVFVPHMIDQYARRAYRLETDIELPNTWHTDKGKFREKEFDNLFKIVGKFFARNKIKQSGHNKAAYSIEEQEKNKSKDWAYCLWMDGMTYCYSFNASCNEYPHVLLHKTFVPYWKDDSVKDDRCIGEDQLKAITIDLNKLFNRAEKEFPQQYDCFDLNGYEYVITHHKIGETLNIGHITHIQNAAMKLLLDFEKKNVIHIDKNNVPKYPYKEINNAKEILKILCDNKFSTKECEIAESILCVSACLWWHIRSFEEWYNESGKFKNLDDESVLKIIRLMRGKNLVDTIISETDLLAKTCECLNSKMFNNNNKKYYEKGILPIGALQLYRQFCRG